MELITRKIIAREMLVFLATILILAVLWFTKYLIDEHNKEVKPVFEDQLLDYTKRYNAYHESIIKERIVEIQHELSKMDNNIIQIIMMIIVVIAYPLRISMYAIKWSLKTLNQTSNF